MKHFALIGLSGVLFYIGFNLGNASRNETIRSLRSHLAHRDSTINEMVKLGSKNHASFMKMNDSFNKMHDLFNRCMESK